MLVCPSWGKNDKVVKAQMKGRLHKPPELVSIKNDRK